MAGPSTLQDYLHTPAEWRGELIEGDLVMIPSPTPWHQAVALNLAEALRQYLGPAGRGRVLCAPCDVLIDERTVLQPDVLILPEGVAPHPPPWRMPMPVWVAEILSPGTSTRDRGIKARIYIRGGVREIWLVDSDTRTVEVVDPGTGRAVLFATHRIPASAILPGFSVPVGSLFPA